MPLLRRLVASAWLSLSVASAQAQVAEPDAQALAADLRIYASEGTAVISDLQPAINGARTTAAQVTPDALVQAFMARYEKAAGRPFDVKAAGVAGDARRAYLAAYKDVVTQAQPALLRGGQDALVPAFFRAQVLKRFNAAMSGRVQVYATNRDKELINGDWAADRVMKGSPLVAEVKTLLAGGDLAPVTRRAGDRYMGYWPMKLGGPCVACHAQNGLKQQEGAFGGALVAEVFLR